MAGIPIHRFKTISEFFEARKFPGPEHPLISLINMEYAEPVHVHEIVNLTFDFYSIAMKRNFNAKVIYGQQEHDFNDGIMTFMAPGQVFRIETNPGGIKHSGWLLLIHPDFLWNTPLAKNIRKYEFFDYSVNEALFLSEKEEGIIANIMRNIEQEYRSNIDKFSQDIIIAQMELLLSYSERFYHRQFITRKITHHQLLDKLETLLNSYFDGDELIKSGLPTVSHVAESLNVSPGYLGSMLRVLTGMNTQQHIHEKLIQKAKEKLSTTGLSVSEIAYELGFEHPQSFSKLFKTKTSISPLEFRQAFN